jgi:peptide deformylase
VSVRNILQLGNPVLRVKCMPVKSFGGEELPSLVKDLQDTLRHFQQNNGFGRGIAAPQVGTTRRVIFIHIERPMALINPVITERSRRFMALWDDCFSFPNLLVKVKRHMWVEVRYRDINGKKCHMRAEHALSELLQHEIDHINGILAIDRALDSKHIILRTEFEALKQRGMML